MKIGLICPYNLTLGGGVQEIVRDMQSHLSQRGHTVKIISPRPQGTKHEERNVIFLGNGADLRSPLHTTPQFSVTIGTDEIDSMLEREAFEVLHFHEPWVPVLSRQILARSRAINIATFHAQIPETLMSRTIAKVVTPYTKSELRYLHALTAVSDAAAEYVSSLTDEPVTIIPNGIDLTRYHTPPTVAPRKTKTILFVGRLEKRKGLKYLLEAFYELSQNMKHVRLIICGSGPDREKLEMQVYDLGLKNVTFKGFVSEKQKLAYLAKSDLFCAPALYGESFGIVLLEAMACGVVTVAGNNVGYSSVMKDMGNLSLVNPRDTGEFARRLELLLTQESLRKEWQTWAKEHVQQFDYPAIINQYEALYHHAIKHHGHKIRAYDDDDSA